MPPIVLEKKAIRASCLGFILLMKKKKRERAREKIFHTYFHYSFHILTLHLIFCLSHACYCFDEDKIKLNKIVVDLSSSSSSSSSYLFKLIQDPPCRSVISAVNTDASSVPCRSRSGSLQGGDGQAEQPTLCSYGPKQAVHVTMLAKFELDGCWKYRNSL